MISASRYSHASDVWAFGILAWELYTAFAVGQNDRIISLPYYNIKTDKVNMSYAKDARVVYCYENIHKDIRAPRADFFLKQFFFQMGCLKYEKLTSKAAI